MISERASKSLSTQQSLVIVILNPVAGQTDPDGVVTIVEAELAADFELIIYRTTPDLGARALTLKAVEQDPVCIVAAGGDGTLSEVAQVLVHREIPLGMIPLGTANVFATGLGVPSSVRAACQLIRKQQWRQVDVGCCNNQIFLVKASVGYGAETIGGTSRRAKDRFGILAYVMEGARRLQRLTPFTVEIETEDSFIYLQATSISVANNSTFTSILAQGPEAVIVDDGLLEVTILIAHRGVAALKAFAELFYSSLRGRAAQDPNLIRHFRAQSIKLQAKPPQQVLIDGDTAGKTPVTIHCVPQSLIVLAPTDGT